MRLTVSHRICGVAFTLASLGLLPVIACGRTERGTDQQDISTWSVHPLFALGDSSAIELQPVASVAWLPDGRLLVVDAGARSLLLVDSTGRSATQLGRVGAGPGEYRSPNSLAVLGDTIVLQDPQNARLGLFRANGAWVNSHSVPPISGPQIRLYRVPGQEFYAVGVQSNDKSKSQLTFIRYNATGPKDTLLRPHPPESPNASAMCRGSDRGLHFFSSPWGATHLEHPGPNRTILSAVSSAYDIIARGMRGDTAARFRGSATQYPITDAEWDSATTDFRAYLAKDPSAQCNTRSLERPSVKPVIRSFFWGDDGHLWVERYDSVGFTFDVFDDRNQLIASIKAPDRVADVEPHVSRNRLVIVAPSADGGHVVRAFRIVRSR